MHAPRLIAAALCAVLYVPVPAAAQSREVWRSEDGESTLELRAFYKTLASVLRLQPDLVQGTEALRQVLDRAALEDPTLRLGPEIVTLPQYGATWTTLNTGLGTLLVLPALYWSIHSGLGVRVMVGVSVEVEVRVGVGVLDGVDVFDGVGVRDAVGVLDGVGVLDAVADGVMVGVRDAVGVNVGVLVGVAVHTRSGQAVGVQVGV